MLSPEDLDLYRFDDLLSDEERSLRDRIRDFVQSRFLPVVNEYWERDDFRPAPVKEMVSNGSLVAAPARGAD